MRLLKYTNGDQISLTESLYGHQVPDYTVLSHTWGNDKDEVTFAELQASQGLTKAGYQKIRFCGERTKRDKIEYFWVDTCCVNKADSAELSEAIVSMYLLYHKAKKCYVYLSDVSTARHGENGHDVRQQAWESGFLASRWFTRGWTLQELLAPPIVEFYSQEGELLGTKETLAQYIHQITTIPLAVLRGASLSQYTFAERLRWAETRQTKREEDRAYCLLGIFDVFMPLMYGEGKNAFRRLKQEILMQSRPLTDLGFNDFQGVYAHTRLQPVATYISRFALEHRIRIQLPITDESDSCREMRTVVVWGLGGSGKSQLAMQYVQYRRQYYQAIFWIEASRRETIERDYVQIYKQIYQQFDIDPSKNTAIAVEDAIASVKSWLQRQEHRCLWVMDGADDVNDSADDFYIDLGHYLPEAEQLDCIITTRSSSIRGLRSNDNGVQVGEMTESEAIQLFQRSAGLPLSSTSDHEELLRIIHKLGRLALAITLAGSYVAETPRLAGNIKCYLPEFRAHRQRLLNRPARSAIHQYKLSVVSAWEISFAAVERRSSLATYLLRLLAFLHFNDIFLSLFPKGLISAADVDSTKDRAQTGWTQLSSLDKVVLDQFSLEEAFATLQAYSLLSWQPKQQAYGMHKLVHAWNYDRQSEEQKQVSASVVLNLISVTIQECRDRLDVQQRLVPHVIANFVAISAVYKRTQRMTVADQDCLTWVADFLHRLGRWGDECKVQALLCQIRASTLGEQHPDTLKSGHNLAVALNQHGQDKEAEELHRQTLRLQKIVLGERHLDTLKSMHSLAEVLRHQGQYKAAEELHRQTLELYKTMLGDRHPNTLASMHSIALVLTRQGQYKEAEMIQRETLELCRTTLGEQHPETLRNMHSLTLILSRRRQYSEAASIHRQMLSVQKIVLGECHPDTLKSMHSLAEVLRHQGQYETAEALHRQTLELTQATVGKQHPNTLASLSCLALVLRQQGQYTKAERIHRQTLEVYKAVLGERHPDTLTSMHNLATALSGRGLYKKAEKLHRQTLELSETVLGERHPDTLKSMHSLAEVLSRQNQYRAAEELHRQTLMLQKIVLGEQHPDTLTSADWLSWVIEAQAECPGSPGT